MCCQCLWLGFSSTLGHFSCFRFLPSRPSCHGVFLDSVCHGVTQSSPDIFVAKGVSVGDNVLANRGVTAERGGGKLSAHSLVGCLSQLTINQASLSRRSNIPTQNRPASNIWAFVTCLPYTWYYTKKKCSTYSLSVWLSVRLTDFLSSCESQPDFS